MTLQQLEYIVALDTHRHYVKAAEKCFVTQPTITLQVKKLEEEVGVQLFDRSRTPLSPTAAGEMIIAKARKILEEAKQLKELARHEKSTIKGEYKIGIIPTLSPYIVPRFSGNFMKAYPETLLEISEMQSESIIEELGNGRIDIGILVTPLGESYIREIHLFNEPFVYYGNQDQLKKKKEIHPKEVEQLEGLWLLNKGHCFRNQVLNICDDSKSNQNIGFQSGSIETLKKMVENYGGFTLIPEMAIEGNESATTIPFISPKPTREVSLAVNKSFAKENLLQVLKKEILAIVPSSFEKMEDYSRVKWR